MKELIHRICEEMRSHLESKGEKPYAIEGTSHKSYELAGERMKQLRLNSSGMELAFIDGGLSEIVCGPSIAMHHLRLARVSYRGLEKEKTRVKDWLMLSKTVEEDGLYYVAKLFPLESKESPKTYRIRMDDPSLKEGLNTGTITRFASMVLRFSELRFAEETAADMEKRSIIVLDGSLQASYTGEEDIMDNLAKRCLEKEVLLMGMAKTSSMLTDSGQDMAFSLRSIEKNRAMHDKMWYYGPVISYDDPSYKADIFFVKLHKSARRLFRVEISNAFEMVDIGKVLGDLATISADPVFLGYPYGLIKADSLARSTNNERMQLRTRLSGRIDIESIEAAKDSHGVLDNIRF